MCPEQDEQDNPEKYVLDLFGCFLLPKRSQPGRRDYYSEGRSGRRGGAGRGRGRRRREERECVGVYVCPGTVPQMLPYDSKKQKIKKYGIHPLDSDYCEWGKMHKIRKILEVSPIFFVEAEFTLFRFSIIHRFFVFWESD